MLLSIKEWCNQRYGQSHLELIEICLVHSETIKAFKEQFIDIFGPVDELLNDSDSYQEPDTPNEEKNS